MKTLFLLVLPFVLVACVESSDLDETPAGHYFVNPYAAVQWDLVQEYHANLHTHTTFSDGNADPHTVIDTYHELGYSILALTDHDNYHGHIRDTALYPWTELNAIYQEIKDHVNPYYESVNAMYYKDEEQVRMSWEDFSHQPWEDRDPTALGMVAIEGSEISRVHHMGSLFNDYAGASNNVRQVLREITERDGLSMFYHPKHYDNHIVYYLELLSDFDVIVGTEIYTMLDWRPGRRLWDEMLHYLMPHRPVWGFGNDDMHSIEGTYQLGWNRNVFILTELTEQAVRQSMKTGDFFLYKPANQFDPPSVQVKRIQATDDWIQLDVIGPVSEIQWLIFDESTRQTRVIRRGESISLADVPENSNFVRAVIVETGGGRLYVQPFGIHRGQPELNEYLLKATDFSEPDLRDLFAEPIEAKRWGDWDFRGTKGNDWFLVNDADNYVLELAESGRVDIYNMPYSFEIKYRVNVVEFLANGSFGHRLRWAWPEEYRLTLGRGGVSLHRDYGLADNVQRQVLVDGSYQSLGLPFSSFPTGEWIDIKIIFLDDSFKLFIDGKQVFAVQDDDPLTRTGRMTFHGWNANVYYDEVSYAWIRD